MATSSEKIRAIVLSTGYAVDIDADDWAEHLQTALVGEIFLTGRPERDWNERTADLNAEILRICERYGLSLFAWMTNVFTHLDELVKEALPETRGN